MFCSECGTKVNENAKFCFNCGAKIERDQQQSDSKIGNNQAHNFERNRKRNAAAEEYINQIRKKVLETYSEGHIIPVASFYKKSEYYEMDANEVDQIYNQTLTIIEKMEAFISGLYKEGLEANLTEEQIKELERFGNTYGVNKKLCHKFLEYYNEKNEITLKRKMVDKMLDSYAETGEISGEIPEEFINIKSASSKELFKNYKKAVEEILKIISERYGSSLERGLNEKEKNELYEIIVEKGFVIGDWERIVAGYEKASGIYDKKILVKKERIYKRVDDIFAKNYIIWGSSYTLEGKYFLVTEIISILEHAEDTFADNYMDLDFSSVSYCSQVQELFDEYEENFYKGIELVEKILEITISVATNEAIERSLDEIVYLLNEMEQNLGCIANRQISEKEERIRRKENRGRWTGGGFGVSGALKGAATAGALNAVGGLMHSSVNAVGNLMSGVEANREKDKTIKEFEQTVLNIMVEMTYMVRNEFIKYVQEDYPEVWFPPRVRDTNKEKNMRMKFRQLEIEAKKEIALQLLKENPYNPLNGITISTEFMNTWDNDMEKTFNEMNMEFRWTENFKKIVKTTVDEIMEALKEKDDEFTAGESADTLREILLINQEINGNNYSGDKEIEELLKKVTKRQEYIQVLSNIQAMEIAQICEIGNNYYQQGEEIKARTLITRGLGNNSTIDAILKNFWSCKVNNKNEALRLLQLYVKENSNEDEVQYKNILYVLAHIKDNDGKTFLVYAAEKNQKEIINELIKNGADVNDLYTLLGKEVTADIKMAEYRKPLSQTKEYVICGFCGKKILRTVKFCNHCGKKLNYKL